jgi:hypothetical protein
MVGYPAAVAVFVAAIGAALHYKNRKRRIFWIQAIVTVLFTFAAFFGVLAFTPRLGPVWAYTGDGPGLLLLLTVVAVSGIAFYHALRHRGEHFHAHGTPATGAILAAAAALVLLNIRHVSGNALSAVAGSWRGAGAAFHAGSAGKVRAVPATVTSGSHGIVIAVLIGVGLLLLIGVVRRTGSRKSGGRSSAGGGRELGR